MQRSSELTEIHLQRGLLSLSVCPALGGAITRLVYQGFDLLRPWDGEHNVRRSGCFVLAPFSNRIGDSGFEQEGVHYPLRNISPDFPLPIHGLAWQRAWTVAHHDETTLTLELTHQPEGEAMLDWPFAFELKHELRLSEEGLDLRLTLRNLDERSMPAGLGWHPYFARHGTPVVQFSAQSVWLSDDRSLPSSRTDIPQAWDFHQARPLYEPGLDNCFSGWDGRARIRWPQTGLELLISASEELAHLVVFTPPSDRGLFALEPVSHLNNALGMPDPQAHGIRLLAPGETMTVSCNMRVAG